MTSDEAKKLREKLPTDVKTLISAEELKQMAEKEVDGKKYTSVMGYVMKVDKLALGKHSGRDITARMLRHLRGISLDLNDDFGLPPYPDLSELNDEEREYLWQWMDNYFNCKCCCNADCVIGRLKEWVEQFKL